MNESYEPFGTKSERIRDAKSFEELYTILRTIGSVTGSDGTEYSAEILIIMIGKVRSGIQATLGYITNTHGIREKVIKLLEEEERTKIETAKQS